MDQLLSDDELNYSRRLQIRKSPDRNKIDLWTRGGLLDRNVSFIEDMELELSPQTDHMELEFSIGHDFNHDFPLPVVRRSVPGNPHYSMATSVRLEDFYGMDYLGPVVLGSGRFSGLKTLRIRVTSTEPNGSVVLGLGPRGSAHLAAALRTGRFTNLGTLSLPACEDVSEILEALKAGHISQLRSFSIMSMKGLDDLSRSNLCEKLDAVFNGGCFKRLQLLELSNGPLDGVDGWEVFTRAIKSGKGPNITSLRLSQNALNRVNLADLVPLLLSNSLEELIMDGCWINSEQVWGLADAIINGPGTGLALKRLDLHKNLLGDSGVDALVTLANSGLFPHLQVLDLSMNSGSSEALISLTETIQRGLLPKLDFLTWERSLVTKLRAGEVRASLTGHNLVSDRVGEAIVRAYLENEGVTTVFDIDWNQVKDLSLRTKVNEYRDRNIRFSALKKYEKLQEVVPLTWAKVFFGGWQEVGKTTLKNALSGDPKVGKYALRRKLKRPVKEPRTRGIELSQLEEGNVSLTLWDLAGHEEYHLLHGTFFPDLGLTRGKATTFVLVFRAGFEGDVKKDLLYWLRFAASSSQKFVKRHVVIVLNCFDGKQCTENDKISWTGLLEHYQKVFEDFLDICLDPFVMDVRFPALVQPLKNHLFEQAQILLQNVTVPKVCFELQEKLKGWSQGDNNSHLPIMSWQVFETHLNLEHIGHQSRSGKDFKAAAMYLHEIGWIIHFDHKELTWPGSEERSVVVLDPSWLCSKVVGELLLPKEMFEELKEKTEGSNGIKQRKGSQLVEKDGSIETYLFEAHFKQLLVAGTQTGDVLSMLERMGVCYRKGTTELIFPALNQQGDYRLTAWECEASHGLGMGRRLAVEDDHWSSIPITLFRHLQVELATDLNFAGSDDSDCRGGKSFSTFKVGELLVLIEFNADHSDPVNDRIDILVKNAIRQRDPTNASLAQVKFICEMMKKVEKLCVAYCPGLKYDLKAIKPWSANEETPVMSEREIMSLQQIKVLLMKDRQYSSWRVHGNQVELKTFFSESELELILEVKSELDDILEIKSGTDVVSNDDSRWRAIRDTQGLELWAEVLDEDTDVLLNEDEVSESSEAGEEIKEPDVLSELSAETGSGS